MTEVGRTLESTSETLVVLDVTNPYDWPEEEPEDYLIHGLLSSSLTSLAADPGAGKTHLALAMALAMLNGDEEFLGREVKRQLSRVLVLTSDASGPQGVRKRVRGLIAEPTDCSMFVIPCPAMGMDWDQVTQVIEEREIEFVILDNVLGFCDGDPSDLGEAKRMTRVFLDWHERMGVATLMLTHTAKPGERGPAQGVNAAYGSRFWTVPARVKASLTHNERSGVRLLKATNNDAELVRLEAKLEVFEARGFWSLKDDSSTTKEGAEPDDLWDALADAVVHEQPEGVDTMRKLGEHYAEKMQRRPETIRQRLSGLIEYNKATGYWVHCE